MTLQGLNVLVCQVEVSMLSCNFIQIPHGKPGRGCVTEKLLAQRSKMADYG